MTGFDKVNAKLDAILRNVSLGHRGSGSHDVRQAPVSDRIAFRIGYMEGRGWPWQRKDIALLREALAEITRLEALADSHSTFRER